MPRRRVTDFALAYSVQRLYQCSSEDSSSELSISSYTSSSSREMTTETPKPCPPPYGYHRTTPNKGPSQIHTHSTLKNNNKNPPHLLPGPNRVKIINGTLLQADMARLQQNSQSDPVHTNKPQHVGVTSPKQMLKPPPPYTKVVRTTSLREYPNHPSRVLPRDLVSGDLKTWHQKNNIGISKPRSLERQGSIRIKRPEPPPYHQIPSQKQVKMWTMCIFFSTSFVNEIHSC